jgi:hypothetical protein
MLHSSAIVARHRPFLLPRHLECRATAARSGILAGATVFADHVAVYRTWLAPATLRARVRMGVTFAGVVIVNDVSRNAAH